jgi:hypothetical protein
MRLDTTPRGHAGYLLRSCATTHYYLDVEAESTKVEQTLERQNIEPGTLTVHADRGRR